MLAVSISRQLFEAVARRGAKIVKGDGILNGGKAAFRNVQNVGWESLLDFAGRNALDQLAFGGNDHRGPRFRYLYPIEIRFSAQWKLYLIEIRIGATKPTPSAARRGYGWANSRRRGIGARRMVSRRGRDKELCRIVSKQVSDSLHPFLELTNRPPTVLRYWLEIPRHRPIDLQLGEMF